MRIMKYLLIAGLLLGLGQVAQAVTVNLFQIQNKTLPLYAEPADNAKTVASLQKGQQIVSFYQQKDWLKVANPSDGQVGWVKLADLKQAASGTNAIQSVIVSNSGKEGNGQQMQVLQYSNSTAQPLTAQQAQTLLQNIKTQQQQIQQQIDKNITETFKTTSEMFKSLDATIDSQLKGLNTPSSATQPATNNDQPTTQNPSEQKK